MTEEHFIERLVFLAKKMCKVYNKKPVDDIARQAILDEVHELGQRFNRDRRRRPWFIQFVIISLILFVLYLVYCIVSEGFFRGPQ